ncbi:unnamed protein product [Microthlaspi erraticum]|uniref:BED-type domain-containing protein n=1 Tax=Microthlaspi erraticum TaxID=1685480 RepID=A0A6D2JZC1_9BRAS|nr:unnamed protein product [Microthlaspi erraticum]
MDTSSNSPGLKRNSNDVGWEYGSLCDPKNPDRLKCKLCGKEMGGGVYRIKEHIAHRKGNVTPCPRSTKEDQSKCMKAVMESINKKKKKKGEAGDVVDADLEANLESSKLSTFQGPVDKFVTGVTEQEETNSMHVVQQTCARWLYRSGVPFDAVESDSFRSFCEALGRLGPGWVPPSQCELRETLLKEEEEAVKEKLKSLEGEWEENGCSILMETWSDTKKKKKKMMSLCVNSRGGTCYLSSKETLKESETGEFIFEYVDKCMVDVVGAEKVVQVITDSAENNLAAAKMLKEKRPGIFWSCCAAHTLNLMLEDIVKLPKISEYIDKAKALTMFIYAHEETLDMMRDYTKERDVVRPGVTRFATTFLTLQSLLEKEQHLKSMFVSSDWSRCKDSKYLKGRSSYYTCLSPAFWNGISRAVKLLEPLVKVLRMVEGEKKASMGFIYGEIVEAKRSIKAAANDLERYYKPIFEIIDEKVKGRLDSPLHLTAYLLNPFYFYNEPTVKLDEKLMNGFLSCVETFYHGEFEKQDQVVNHEFRDYRDKLKLFGIPLALRGCEKNKDEFNPGNWWSLYGSHVPNLAMLARKILSLASNCQRNWSVFEEIHKSERNTLDADQMNSLVFVQFNSKLFNEQKRIKEENLDVLVGGDEENVEEWFVELDQDGEEEVIDEDEDGDSAFHFVFESDDELL